MTCQKWNLGEICNFSHVSCLILMLRYKHNFQQMFYYTGWNVSWDIKFLALWWRCCPCVWCCNNWQFCLEAVCMKLSPKSDIWDRSGSWSYPLQHSPTFLTSMTSGWIISTQGSMHRTSIAFTPNWSLLDVWHGKYIVL